MTYISKEAVAAIRAELKKEFPNLKFSVVRDNHSAVDVKIMSGDVDFSAITGDTGRASLNPYTGYREDNLITEADEKYAPFAKMFNKIIKIMKGQNWFDKSDVMTDYFHTAYYLSLGIGKWDKPYQFKK